MKRWLGSATVIFFIAFVASLLAHLQVFGVLGKVAEWAEAERAHKKAMAPVEIDFEATEETPKPHNDEVPVEVVGGTDTAPTPTPNERVTPPAPKPEAVQPDAQHPENVAPQPHPQLPTLARAPAQATPPPPQPQADHRQSVQQRSNDPNTPPPPDARFLARENNHVQEETVASLRNYQRNDPDPQAGPTERADSPDEGNAARNDIADMREMQGSNARAPTPREAAMERPREASTERPPNIEARGNSVAEGPTNLRGEHSQGTTARNAGATSRAGGGDERPSLFVINDGNGSFTITLPSARAAGQGEGNAGGVRRAGSGASESGFGFGGGGQRGANGGGRGNSANGPDLRVSWNTFEDTFTPEQLQREREAYLQERRSRTRGQSREQNWRAFRAAIENFVPNVRPGTSTALNAAASPFAEYLASVHLRIHREFVDRFIANLPGGQNEFSDETLVTKLEIILNRDGTIHRVGVVATSGYMPYDYGAFEAVMRGQPYPEAPSSILSGDGKVYMHWSFNRDDRHCGTWNAEPYILPHPGESAPMRNSPLHDIAPQGGVIPRGATPAGEQGVIDPATDDTRRRG